MSEQTHTNPAPTELARREFHPEALLEDLDARVAAAGSFSDYLYTMPRAELHQMLRRADTICDTRGIVPDEVVPEDPTSTRIVEVRQALVTEESCRDLVEQPALNEEGELAHRVPDDAHQVLQSQLAERLAYHARMFDEAEGRAYELAGEFDHAQATSDYLDHLVPLQVDAYDRRLEVVPCERSEFAFGRAIHERLTRGVMSAQDERDEVALEHEMSTHNDYIKGALASYREFREYVINETAQRVFPHDIPEDLQTQWMASERVVDQFADRLREAQSYTSDAPAEEASLTQPTTPGLMRASVLADLDQRIADAGSLDDYLYTTPRVELGAMLERVDAILDAAHTSPGDDAAARGASDRILSTSLLLDTELQCRTLAARDPVDQRGELTYRFPDELHATMQEAFAERVAYHSARLDGPQTSATGFDHGQAGANYARHLVAQQVDAYDRGLPVVACEETKFQLGRQVHERLTRDALCAHRKDKPAALIQAIGQVGARIANHEHSVRDALEHFRDYRDYVIRMTGQDVYPHDLPENLQAQWREAASLVNAETRRPVVMARERDRSIAADIRPEPRVVELPRTVARDAYLDARDQVAAVGAALDDPRMRAALELANLEHGYKRVARSLTHDYETARKPPAWRRRERTDWQRDQPVVQALMANSAEQERLRAELGPDCDKLARRATELTQIREEILGRTIGLQRSAIEEELARQPEWLTKTLGPQPAADGGRWHSLAGEMAANRLRFAVTDDADPGIRAEQSLLANKVAAFRAEAGLDQRVSLAPAVGLGI